ncbi:hypothetical protein SAMN05444149_105222 [Pseudosulfitobacter pseudonitzschiae]|uniref:SH3b domain-containing protein n=1 Tax=Pseudosulfitobacter pseudonitzschiae TaxID=1402135 RepID=A0A073J1F2_9RHOB|nr:hypothetical protein [Pseudosulfitobacter pseudonitzschiae]KEJ95670.1 hypothetical protein SUH3_19355 [Pseudosulfitobacter pseudonitzschiae]QKS08381.1 hypothetical protein HT745_07780 [Pseudosulfitobacter pseudonitzschiae]SHF72426.1 hypothetical protein SAMN05444149_105222 [Pseudosulfitobacter pseudonitzschiae]
MQLTTRFAALLFVLSGVSSPALASEACEVVATVAGAASVPLHAEPDESSDLLYLVPVGDIVLYPQQDMAPAQSESWLWVRHDRTQRDIWQSGIAGWLRVENVTDCG